MNKICFIISTAMLALSCVRAQTRLSTPVTILPAADHSVGGTLQGTDATGGFQVWEATDDGIHVNSNVLTGRIDILGNTNAVKIELADTSGFTNISLPVANNLTSTGLASQQSSSAFSVASTPLDKASLMSFSEVTLSVASTANLWASMRNDGAHGLLMLGSGAASTGPEVTFQNGSPNGSVTASNGSLSMDSSGAAPWFKTGGTNNTGWIELLKSDTTQQCDTIFASDCVTTNTSQIITALKDFQHDIQTHNIIPDTSTTYTLGLSGTPWLEGFFSLLSVTGTAAIATVNSTSMSASSFIIPASNHTSSIGLSTFIFANVWADTYNTGSGNGGTGTLTVRNAAGTGTCTITVSGGIMIGTTC